MGLAKQQQLLEAFCSGKRLAQDVCWAMAIAPSCSDVMVTKAFDLGWHISCVAEDLGRRQVELILGDSKSARVNWL